jgi:hypothetical protein
MRDGFWNSPSPFGRLGLEARLQQIVEQIP